MRSFKENSGSILHAFLLPKMEKALTLLSPYYEMSGLIVCLLVSGDTKYLGVSPPIKAILLGKINQVT